jgi:AcrR family transcriptional regulator
MDPTSTKARVLEAAARVFLEHGFDGSSMDLVRQEAGVSNGSLYHHFPTKAQLADALYAHLLRSFHTALMECLAPRASAQSGVKAMVRLYVDWVVQNPGCARLLQKLRRSVAIEADAAETGQANAEGFAALREWIARKVEAGEMRPLPFPVWVAVVFAPAMSLTRHWVEQPQPTVPPKVRTALEHAAWMAVAP